MNVQRFPILDRRDSKIIFVLKGMGGMFHCVFKQLLNVSQLDG